jgi:hypothetical protein
VGQCEKNAVATDYSFAVSLTVKSVTVDNAMIVYEGLWSTFQSTTVAPERQFHATDQLGDTAQLTFNGK